MSLILPPAGTFRDLWIDVETHDPLLDESGPSWSHGEGYITGYAFAWDDEPAQYVPVRHASGNVDPTGFLRWLQDAVRRPDLSMWGHSLAYDLGWMRAEGTEFHPQLHYRCTQLGAAMIDENMMFQTVKFEDEIVTTSHGYNLDALAKTWLKSEGKRPEKMLDYMEAHKLKGKPQEHMAVFPAEVVEEYACQDIEEMRRLARYEVQRIEADKLGKIWELESRLLPHLVETRRRGVRIDVAHAERTLKMWEATVAATCNGLGIESPWNADQLARVLAKENILVPRTAKTKKASITRQLLHAHRASATVQSVQRARDYDKACQFLRSILAKQHGGRLYPEIAQLKSDEGGAVSGRISMRKPNGQQMPNLKKFPIGGKGVRSSFLPEEGEQWISNDYNQQEPRFLIHLAGGMVGRFGVLASDVQPFINEFTVGGSDLHEKARVIILERASRDIGRPAAKAVNFGLIYGQGGELLAYNLGLDIEEALAIRSVHRQSIPFLSAVARALSNKAESVGVIVSILGRRFHFDDWEPINNPPAKREGHERPLPYELALEKWGEHRIRRAFAYRAINRWIQGSSGDQTKKAWVECADAGYLPLLQVHDELDFSGDEADAKATAEIMRDTIPLRIPVVVDTEIGPSWGEAK